MRLRADPRKLAIGACLQLVGCGAPPPAMGGRVTATVTAPAAKAPTPPSSEFRAALQRARELRREAEGTAAPATQVPRDQAVVALVAWLFERRDKSRAASTAYDQTLSRASANEQILVHRETGDLWFDFVAAGVQATLAIMPPTARSPEQIASLRATMLTRFSAETSLARQSFVLCSALASPLPAAKADLEHCEGRIHAIDSSAPRPVDRALQEWRFTRLAVPPRKKQRASPKAPCQFGGSAQPSWSSRLYLDPQGPSWNLSLEDVDVVQLTPPDHAGERIRLSIDYPLRASGYVDAKDGLLVTARRADIVKGHIWLDPGTPVSAFGVQGAVATVTLANASQSAPIVSLQLPCSDLALAGNVASPTYKTNGETAHLSGAVPLYDAPSGKLLGEINVDLGLDVRVRARRNGWVRVATAEPRIGSREQQYRFDGWIAERFAGAVDDFLSISVMEAAKTPPSHLTIAPLSLRLLPDPSAPVVSSLNIGIAFLTGEERGGMRRARLDAVHGNNEGDDFWVETAELAARASTWPARPHH